MEADPDSDLFLGVALAIPGLELYFPINHLDGENCDEEVKKELFSTIHKHPLLVFHNAVYDMDRFDKIDEHLDNNFACTMMMQHFIDENLFSKSLDYVSKYHGGRPKERSPEMQKTIDVLGWRYVPTVWMAEYAAHDARITSDLFVTLRPLWEAQYGPLSQSDALVSRSGGLPAPIRSDRPWKLPIWDIEQTFLRSLIVLKRNGIKIDRQRCIEKKLQGNIIQHEILKDLGWNPGSPKQIGHFLLEEMGYPIVRTTPKGEPSFDKHAMEEYDLMLANDNSPVAHLISRYRGWNKTTSSNYIPYLELADANDVLHPNYKPHGTVTGRLSCEKPNLQQIPTESPKEWNGDLKLAFITRSPDTYLVDFDYGNLELRLGAAYCNEEALLEAFKLGIDVFSSMAEQLGWERQDVKTFNYACVPLDTEILTKRGWLRHNEVQIGDETLGYNSITHLNQWTKITDIVKYNDAEIEELNNSHWSFRSTPNHRWLTWRRRPYRESFKTTEDIGCEDNLILSAPINTIPTVHLTLEEIALIAWIYTDGSLRWSAKSHGPSRGSDGGKHGVSAMIHQYKKKGINALDTLMKSFDHSRYDYNGKITYYIKPYIIRDIWERAGLHERPLDDLVLKFSLYQAEVFYEAASLAESYKNMFYQNDGEVLRAFQIVSYMCGYHPRLRHRTANQYMVYSRRPHVTGQRLKHIRKDNQDVWCVQTELGTWTARQENQIVLTGNTLYGAGEDRIKTIFNISNDEAREMRRNYFKTYSSLYQGINKAKNEMKKKGYIEYWTGRRRHNCDPHKVFNSLIQGGAFEIMKRAMIRLSLELPKEVLMVLQVHDSVTFEVPKGMEYIEKTIVEIMETSAPPELEVQFPVEKKLWPTMSG